jgi:hypothetical protein
MAIACVCFLATCVGYADTLTLKSGMRLQGTWQGGDGKSVLFLTKGPKPESYPLSEIVWIDFGADTSTSIPTAKIHDLSFEFVDAVAEDAALRVTLYVTNGGSDLEDVYFVASAQPPPPKLVDDAGNEYTTRDVTIGNQRIYADLVNGVRTKMVLNFAKLPSVKGVLTMASIRQLTLGAYWAKRLQGSITFEGLPIKK